MISSRVIEMDFNVKKQLITGLERSGLKCEYSGKNIACRKGDTTVISILSSDFVNGEEKMNLRIMNQGYYVNNKNVRDILKIARKEIKKIE